MSGIAGSEVFLLIIIGLIVLGPKRLPQVASQIGSWLGQARRMTRMMKRQLEDEINLDLDSINVKKQLGLDQSGGAGRSDSVSRPRYVNEAGPAAVPAASAATVAAAEDEAAAEELPDDYSPAHAIDEPGTGVGDDDDDRQVGDETGPPETAVVGTSEDEAPDPAASRQETA